MDSGYNLYILHIFKSVPGTPIFCKRGDIEEGILELQYVGFSIGSTASNAPDNSETTLFLSIENQRRWLTDVLEDESIINWRILTRATRLRGSNSGGSSNKIWNDRVPILVSKYLIIIIHLFLSNKMP